MVRQVADALDVCEADADVRVMVIASALDRHFSAGADLETFRDLGADGMDAWCALVHRIVEQLRSSAKPILAAINGVAVGGGLEMALHCDVRFAARDARFGQPEVNINFIPPVGATQALVRLIGRPRALRYLYDGTLLDVHRALEARSRRRGGRTGRAPRHGAGVCRHAGRQAAGGAERDPTLDHPRRRIELLGRAGTGTPSRCRVGRDRQLPGRSPGLPREARTSLAPLSQPLRWTGVRRTGRVRRTRRGGRVARHPRPAHGRGGERNAGRSETRSASRSSMNRPDGMNTCPSGTSASTNTVADALARAATIGGKAPAPE